jgi:hypothetical protein
MLHYSGKREIYAGAFLRGWIDPYFPAMGIDHSFG